MTRKTVAGQITDDMRVDQFYRTPSWVVRALKPVLRDGYVYCDPCAGDGAIVRELVRMGYAAKGVEINPMRAAGGADVGITVGDGLEFMRENYGGSYVINPPFTGESWHPWVEAARVCHEAWVLLPNTVYSCAAHLQLLDGAASIVLPRRVSFDGGAPRWGCTWFGFGVGLPERGPWGRLEVADV